MHNIFILYFREGQEEQKGSTPFEDEEDVYDNNEF